MQESAVDYLKSVAVQKLLSVDDLIAASMGDIIELIARDSFDQKWQELMNQFTQAIALNDPVKSLRIIQTANPIFKKIRFMPRSDALYLQI